MNSPTATQTATGKPLLPKRREISPRDALWAKITGTPLFGIPFATYNLHPYGRHGSEPSYHALLDTVLERAAVVVKHELQVTSPATRHYESTVETSPMGTRRTVLWHTPKGPLRSVSLTPPGQPGYVVEHYVKSDEDVAKVLAVEPGRTTFDPKPTEELLKRVGDRGVLYVSYPDPMYNAASLFDYQDFVVRCLTEPDRVQALIEHLAEEAAAYVHDLATTCRGLPLLFYTAGPEVATPPMLPPSAFRRFVTPHQQRLIGILHAQGHRACIHCHGRVRQVLDQILETGADALEPIEPPDQGDITLRELLDRVAGKLCLMGHIQDQEFYRGVPGLLRRRVEEIVAVVAPSDRYVMTPTCTPFQFPASAEYLRAYAEWLHAAADLLP